MSDDNESVAPGQCERCGAPFVAGAPCSACILEGAQQGRPPSSSSKRGPIAFDAPSLEPLAEALPAYEVQVLIGQAGRKRGGQPGHKEGGRDLARPEDVDETRMVKPQQCKGCSARLTGDDPNPLRHQITDIPPVKPSILEVQLHALTCDECGESTRAELPADVHASNFPGCAGGGLAAA